MQGSIVTKSGGKLVIIDKNDDCYGELEIGALEQWFNIDDLKHLMDLYCDNVEVKKGLKCKGVYNSNLFTAWIGTVRWEHEGNVNIWNKTRSHKNVSGYKRTWE